MPLLSVIIPVFGDPQDLEACLNSVSRSEFQDFELLVADDCSPSSEEIQATSGRYRARLVRLESRQGPGPARNAAARLASGDYLVFFDADETVHPETLGLMAAAFARDPSLDAVVGAYDRAPGCRGFVGKFRNLLHSFVHDRSAGEMSTFWAGCGAVRRTRFEALGGFLRHPVEDVEFGIRLRESGGRILLDPSIQVKHHKDWSVASMVRTDVLVRAAPWTELMMNHGLPRNLNFRWIDRFTVSLSASVPLLAWLAAMHGGIWTAAVAANLAAVGILQWPLFRCFSRNRGIVFALACFPLYILHLWAAAAGFALGLARWEIKRDRSLPAVAALLAVLVLGVIQGLGGAFQAEFDADFDETAHFVTGMFVRDYLVQWPLPSPLPWAEQFYLHYPRVAFGHWPPLFYLLEAGWWLFLPAARWSAMLLVGILATASALAFYRLARRLAPANWALGSTILLAAAPVFQESASRVMSDQLSLLLAIVFLDALARFLETGARGAALAAFGCAGLSVLVRGTGLTLIPAPFLAIALTGQWRVLKRLAVPALVLGLVIGGCAGLYLWQTGSLTKTLRWAGAFGSAPWPIEHLVNVAGLSVLAAAGAASPLAVIRRNPIVAAAAALLLSTLISSYVLRAMNQTRHWITVLPALLLLALAVTLWARDLSPARAGRSAAAVIVVALLLLFPWQYQRQQAQGSLALLRQFPSPGRFLVSAASTIREGGWVALIASREARPASMVARATKVLASSRFAGNKYRTLTSTPAETLALLDRHAIETVILDEAQAPRVVPPHHVLLRRAVTESAVWRPCVQQGPLHAYCRAEPPRVPREPLKVPLGRFGREFILER